MFGYVAKPADIFQMLMVYLARWIGESCSIIISCVTQVPPHYQSILLLFSSDAFILLSRDDANLMAHLFGTLCNTEITKCVLHRLIS